VPSEREITSFITPELHRARHSSTEREGRLSRPQLELANAIDDDSILERDGLPDPSEGAIVQLRAFEADQDRHAEYERNIDRLTTTLAGDRTALGSEISTLRAQIARLERERDRAASITTDALAQAGADIRAISRSRTVRLAGTIGSLRRAVTPGENKASVDPFDKTLRRIERSQSKVDSILPTAARSGSTSGRSTDRTTEEGRDDVAPG
jgi:hypothetical protein